MNAKNMFADWYRNANPHPNQDEIQRRLAAIAAVCEYESIDYWYDVIQLYIGSSHAEVTWYVDFAQMFKDEDLTFPFENNEQLIKTLAGISILNKLEPAKKSESCDFIGNALCCIGFGNKKDTKIWNMPIEKGIEYNLSRNIELRDYEKNNKNYKFNPQSYEVSYEMEEDSEELTVDEVNVNKEFSNIKKSIDSIINSLHQEIYYRDISLKTLSEETNILWWIFGENSSELEQHFSKVGFQKMSILSGMELAELTTIASAHPSSKAFISKVLMMSGMKRNSKLSVAEAIDSVDFYIREKISENYYHNEYFKVMPILHAIDCSVKMGEGGSWIDLFNNYFNEKDFDKKYSPNLISNQIFREILISKNIKENAPNIS